MSPARVRLERTKGYRKPADAIVVARPSKWGNPFAVTGDWIMWRAVSLGYRGDAAGRRQAAVALYRGWLTGEPVQLGPLAASTTGGAIEFGDGAVVTVGEHVMGVAEVASALVIPPAMPAYRPPVDALSGHDLACWCRLDEPCHADVLLEVANG